MEVAAAQAESAREAWRRDMRAAFLPPGGGPMPPGSARVGIRLPNGSRSTVVLAKDASVLSLFAAVDAALHPLDGTGSSTNAKAEAPDGLMREHALTPDEWWGFKLVLAYPRREILWEAEKRIGDVDVLKGGGQVLVEFVADEDVRSKGKGRSSPEEDDDDEYHTESD